MKQLSSMTTGPACKRLQHAADAGAARDVAVLADLGAGADRGPGVDHGAAVDIGAEIDEARHQDDARGDIGGAADDAAGDGAEAGGAEAGIVPAGELGRHLVEPDRRAEAGRPDRRGSTLMSLRRNDSSTAFFSHWLTCQSSPTRSATRKRPSSRPASAASTASRTAPLVPVLSWSRFSQADLMAF